MFDKLFNWGRKKEDPVAPPMPQISFGRYADNNKTIAKTARWTNAENLFKEKKYAESISSFFDYLTDEEVQNVLVSQDSGQFSFQIFQGSKIVRGQVEGDRLTAGVRLAKMPQPSIPVMRRLLEMNFTLYYSRYALQNDELYMRFDAQIDTANPSKLYYGLKELAIKSDKQDDLLVQDFAILEPVGKDHITEIPQQEKEAKYLALQNWISETLEKIAAMDADKFSGGISYLLLSLVYRIDFLIAPEGQLLNDLEKIAGIYFKKDDRQTIEKSRDMIEEFKKLKEKSREEVFKDLFKSKFTFSIVTPQTQKTIADVIHEANSNMLWYRDNNHDYFANKIVEYGLSYCQYSYSLPRCLSQLFELFMQVNYPDYFSSLGFRENLYNFQTNIFNQDAIINRIWQVQNQWKEKYPKMNFKTESLSFSNLLAFNESFTLEIEGLNMDSPK